MPEAFAGSSFDDELREPSHPDVFFALGFGSKWYLELSNEFWVLFARLAPQSKSFFGVVTTIASAWSD